MPDTTVRPVSRALIAAQSRFGKILAPITGADRDKSVVATAFETARLFDAHVECLFVHPDPRLAVPYMGDPLSPAIVDEIVKLAREGVATARKAAHATVTAAANAANIPIVERPRREDKVTASFREVAGDFAQCVAHASRLSDLVVFGPLSPTEWPDVRQGFIEVLIKSDRPILVSPDMTGGFARKVAIGWDGSMPAARALTASLPFLERTAKIEVLAVRHEQGHPVAFRDIEDYLAIHGLTCSGRVVDQSSRSVGEALLDAAAESGADLLVMGGYGHSHMREVILGGVSQHVAWHATMPVLLVH